MGVVGSYIKNTSGYSNLIATALTKALEARQISADMWAALSHTYAIEDG
jgi:hypothetical protein